MILTDTHTHLYSEQFDTDRNAMMERAFDTGIFRFFIPALVGKKKIVRLSSVFLCKNKNNDVRTQEKTSRIVQQKIHTSEKLIRKKL